MFLNIGTKTSKLNVHKENESEKKPKRDSTPLLRKAAPDAETSPVYAVVGGRGLHKGSVRAGGRRVNQGGSDGGRSQGQTASD